MTEFEERCRRTVRWVSSDDGATWAFRAALVLSVGVFYVVGRHQWFTRDDWAYVISREATRTNSGWQHWLFDAQDGHWLTIPVLIFHFTRVVFGLGSYWPFLLPTMAAHVAAVLLTRVICRRVGVTAWTTTLICSMLLVFGSGWDNIVFAIQISYNLSLVAFLAQIVLVDHDGPADRRDYSALAIGIVGLMSSGFGPIFLVGVLAMLALRRRWRAALIVGVPQLLLYAWWYVTWETDSVEDLLPGDRSQLPAYVVRGVTATFESTVTFTSLAGVAVVATLAISMWRGHDWTRRTTMFALWSTVVLMFAAIGFERLGFGVLPVRRKERLSRRC